MEVRHVAHSARCALLLDEGGVCRWFVLKVEDEAAQRAARRCVGAQFVATLAPDTPGLLGHEPKVGANLLLARVDGGRVSLVRFGPLTAFEALGEGGEIAKDDEAAPAEASDVPLAIARARSSYVALRAATPADDADATTLRFARAAETRRRG